MDKPKPIIGVYKNENMRHVIMDVEMTIDIEAYPPREGYTDDLNNFTEEGRKAYIKAMGATFPSPNVPTSSTIKWEDVNSISIEYGCGTPGGYSSLMAWGSMLYESNVPVPTFAMAIRCASYVTDFKITHRPRYATSDPKEIAVETYRRRVDGEATAEEVQMACDAVAAVNAERNHD